MATPSLTERLSRLKKSRKGRERSRKELESRRFQLEKLEDRHLMALTPPAILPNSGELLNNGVTLHVAPQDLTFEFNDLVDFSTVAAGIRLRRAGKDGVFDPPNTPGSNDVTITPGFLGRGDDDRQVVMRFASPLPDDIYRIDIIGAGANPLRDTAGAAFNLGQNIRVDFNLDLGAQVVAIVPQPVRRLPNGTLSQTDAAGISTRNKIVVHFNNDDLLDGPGGAENPNFYRLYVTRNTLDPNDDSEFLPTSVVYDPATDTATLTFGQFVSFESFFTSPSDDDGSRDPAKSFRLRIGTDELRRSETVTTRLESSDPGSGFLTALDIGNQITQGTQGGSVQFAQEILDFSFTLPWPGDGTDPGHRDIPAENHLGNGPDGSTAISFVSYNFQPTVPPAGPGGVSVPNLITEAQKQRAREILELFSRYAGIQFVETASSGLTIATADFAVYGTNSAEPSGPGGIIGQATSSHAIMDAAEVWNDQFGFGSNPPGLSWFDTAMHEIGHSIGLGHTYDLPPHTVMGESGVLVVNSPSGEPVFPGDHDIVHLNVLHRPDSKDIDMYKFTLDGTGVFTAETFAERLPNSSGLDTGITLYRESIINNTVTRTLVARNDDYFSRDSFLELTLEAGTYYVGVSASKNDNYDPNIENSGIGGTTQGDYEVKFNFRRSATNSIVDAVTPANPSTPPLIIDDTNVAFDGDGDGTPGGVNNFWFRAAAGSGQQALGKARTIFVDRSYVGVNSGSLAQPYSEIDQALAVAQPYDIVRIIGNGGADGNLATLTDNLAYHLGFAGPGAGASVLRDGSALNVPKDVTVMIDAGVIIQSQRSQISVGSTAPSIFSDRSGGALQVLGTPNVPVYFTSYNEGGANRIGQDENTSVTPPAPGDWGGLSFKTDLDRADGRFVHEEVGVFLNYVNNADIRYGGGQVNVNSIFQVVNAIDLTDARPTITFNRLTRNADAAIGANPDSFEESNFQAPKYWPAFSGEAGYNPSNVPAATPSTSYTLDYSRIGPEIHGNTLVEFDTTTVNSIAVNGAVTTNSSSIGRTTASFSHVVPTGNNRLLVVSVMTDGVQEITGVTFAGLALTPAIERDSGVATGSAVSIWYLVAPPVGSGTVMVTFGASTDPSVVTATNFTGVDQRNPIGNVVGANATVGTAITTSLATTAAGSLIFGAAAAQRGGSAPFLPAGGVTERWDVSTGASLTDDIGAWGGTRPAPLPGTFALSTTSSASDDWALAAIEIKSLGITAHSNSTNGLFVRTRTPAGGNLEELTVAGRFDDKDIVHVIQENLSIRGTPGGATREPILTLPGLPPALPPVNLVVSTSVAADTGASAFPIGTSLEYKVVYVDILGNEGQASATINVTVGLPAVQNPALPNPDTQAWVRLDNLTIPGGDFVGRRLYRRINGSGEFVLVDLLPAQLTTFVDRNLPKTGEPQLLRVQATPSTIDRARLDGSLKIDPAIIVKADGARFDVGIGATLHAEGLPGSEIIFTSLFDDRYGAGGTFDTPSDNTDLTPKAGAQGDWAGFFFGPDSKGSIDHAYVGFGGGLTRVEGTFAGFNAVEIHEADVRIAHTEFDSNADGLGGQAPVDRFGRGFNAAGTIFVRGAQPVIVENDFINNEAAMVNANVNAFTSERVVDLGRQTGVLGLEAAAGLVTRIAGHLDNNGPLIDNNRSDNNGLNGMVVRGATLTTEVVWDDTDIVHIVFDAVNVPDFHTFGGFRLESSPSESLVVKLLGDNAGITANGRPLEIDDRIGGIVQVLGQPGVPVVMTSLHDCTVGAGTTPDGKPQTDTENIGTCGTISSAPIVDVMLVFDDTGSFAGTAPALTAAFNQVVANLQAALPGASLAFGVSRFEEYVLSGIGGPDERPFTLNQPLIDTSVPNFTAAINAALNRSAPGFGGDGPETAIEALWQVATGLGFDGNDDGDTVDSGAAGVFATQVTPGASGDVPAFSSYTADPTGDPAGPTIPSSGTLGGVGFRANATNRIVILATDIGYAYEPDGIDPYVGVNGVTVPAANIQMGGRNTTPGGRGASIQETIDALIALDVKVIGLGASTAPFVRTPLESLALLTGAVDIAGNPLFFPITSGSGTSVSDAIVSAVIGAVDTSTSGPGDWQGITIDQYAHDRNVETVLEQESATGNGLANASPDNAQSLGLLAPFEKGGDETLRLGYTVHGVLNRPGDLDVYSFKALAGTEIWVDIDRSWHALDPVVELIDDQGNVLARSMDSTTESLGDGSATNLGRRMQKTPPYEGVDFYTTNPRDPGMRIVLPGPASSNPQTYHLRVRSASGLSVTEVTKGAAGINEVQSVALLGVASGGTFNLTFNGQTTAPIAYNADAATVALALEGLGNINPGDVVVTGPIGGPWRIEFAGSLANTDWAPILANTNDLVGGITEGGYQLQLRLREVDEFGGATVRYADIRYATNGIRVLGQPTHSPLAGEHTEQNNATNNNRSGSQDLGNLLNSDRGTLATSGSLSGLGDVDWYEMEIRYDATQGTSEERWWSTIFDIDYADGFGRPNTVVHIFNQAGELVYSSRDSNINDDGRSPLNASDVSDLSRGSSGTGTLGSRDPFLGSAELPEGTYFIAIANNGLMPLEYNQFTQANATNPLIRLEPINSVIRLVEDHIGSTGGSAVDVVENNFINLNPTGSITPWNLNDVTLFVTQHGGALNTTRLLTVDPFSGNVETTIGRFNPNTGDIAMHPRGRLYTYSIFGETGNTNRFSDAQTGNYYEIDTGTSALNPLSDDGIITYEQDPASANTSVVLANVVPGPARVGEGIHFRAMDIGYYPGNSVLNQDYVGLAVGGRDEFLNATNDPRNTLRNDLPNILYAFNPDTGVATSSPTNDRTDTGRLNGAGTQIVERGILDTLIDVNPTGNADAIQVVEATIYDELADFTTFQIMDSGYATGPGRPAEIPTTNPTPTTFRVRSGPPGPGNPGTLFEFDAGPEALFRINPTAVNQQIQDGQGFNVNGQPAAATRVEFDTGAVINVLGAGNQTNYPIGSFITVTDVDPDPLGPASRPPMQITFEFIAPGGNTTIANAIPIVRNGASPTAMADLIVSAINSQQIAQGFTTQAVRLSGTPRISLTNVTLPTINPNDDSDVVEGGVPAVLVPGLVIVGARGVTPGNVSVRIEETSLQADLRDAFQRTGVFPGVNRSNTMPFNTQIGVNGGPGVGRVEVGFEGNRVNFSGATSITNSTLQPIVFDTVGSLGGVTPSLPNRIPVPFLAEDDQATIAQRMATALNAAGFSTAQATGTGVTISGATVVSADPPLATAAQAPGGVITGIASINGSVYVVTDNSGANGGGGLFRVLSPLSAGNARLDYIETATDLLGINFSSLAAGPRHVEGGRYQNLLFGIDSTGELFGFDTDGELQPIFSSVFNPVSGQIEAQTSVQTGLTDVRGLAFSNLDYNLWHGTPNRDDNAGHGINITHDESRVPSTVPSDGGTSLYFGFENVNRNNVPSVQQYAPAVPAGQTGVNNISFPGGAHGSVETNTFSLKGYSAADAPVLYYNYLLRTEDAFHDDDAPIFMRDAFRAFVAGDDGVWHLLTTNDSSRIDDPPPPINDDFDFAPNRVQETWDNAPTWRQARISLADFAGRDNLRLRFDFSTAGSMNVGNYVHLNGNANTPTNGDELRAVDGIYLRDRQNFTLTAPGTSNRLFEFDLGYTLVAPAGAGIPNGARFSVDGINFQFDLGGVGVPVGFTSVPYLVTDSPEQVAQAIQSAIQLMGASPTQLDRNRVNLRAGNAGGVFGALNVTLSGPAMPTTFLEGAPAGGAGNLVNVHSGMSRTEVREAIALVMANVYAANDRAQIKTHDELIRLISYRWVGQSAGPNADPQNQRLMGATTSLPGDAWGAFNVSRNPDNTTDANHPGALRGQNNGVEGVYIDDIIIGFAERGEMATASNGANDSFTSNPGGNALDVIAGAYTLEVRRGREAGIPNPIPDADPPLVMLPQMHTNDRLTPGRMLETPAGSAIPDGLNFSLSDGINTLTFEFNNTTIPGSGVVPGRVQINYSPLDTNQIIAQRVVQAVNSFQVQAVLKISAQLGDGVAGTGSTTNRVSFDGNISVPNQGTVGAISAPLNFRLFGLPDGRSSQYGDSNLFRDQGQILLIGNEIQRSSQWGIFIDNGARTAADGNTSHQGPVRTLSQQNSNRLVPGVVVTNNLVHRNGVGGILYSGDGGLDAAVPFGRVVNNTVYGNRAGDVGIQVDNGAGPTLLNNIVANFAQGVNVLGATSQAQTVLGGMLFQNNTNDSNVGLGGDFPIVVPPTAQLFVNPSANNFYLAAQSAAIDSSIDSLLDRPSMITVGNPLGIAPSPIKAPERDMFGQVRADDETVATPNGFGDDVFKDRGAIDRVDDTGPNSVLIAPEDNDSAGADQDPAATVVVLTNQALPSFVIRLIDRFDVNGPAEGSDIDDFTVNGTKVRVEVLGTAPRTLIQGIDYTFDYDATNNLIILTPLGGLWPQSTTYRVTLDNGAAGGIADRAGNILLPNQLDGSHSYTIFLGTAVDWGDAPTSYGTLGASLPPGPSHQVVPGMRLGPTNGAEPDGQPSAAANLDDSDDGVTNIVLQSGGPLDSSTITVNASLAGKIDVWIDLDLDGDFLDPLTADGFDDGEYVPELANLSVVAGLNVLSFTLPEGPRGQSILRVRYTSLGIGNPHGPASDGEVEDYQVLVSGPEFQNPANRLDVNNDGFIAPNDALYVIDYLNLLIPNGLGQLPLPPQPPNAPLDPTGGGVPEMGRYLDVDGNGFLTPADAIILIDYLNNPSSGEGEGEAEGEGEGESAGLVASFATLPSGSRTAAEDNSAGDLAIPATLLISPNIVIEERSSGTSGTTLDPLWMSQGDDFALDLVAAGGLVSPEVIGNLLGVEEEGDDLLLDTLDDGTWSDLLDDLASDTDGK